MPNFQELVTKPIRERPNGMQQRIRALHVKCANAAASLSVWRRIFNCAKKRGRFKSACVSAARE